MAKQRKRNETKRKGCRKNKSNKEKGTHSCTNEFDWCQVATTVETNLVSSAVFVSFLRFAVVTVCQLRKLWKLWKLPSGSWPKPNERTKGSGSGSNRRFPWLIIAIGIGIGSSLQHVAATSQQFFAFACIFNLLANFYAAICIFFNFVYFIFC